MRNSNTITDTESRLLSQLTGISNKVYDGKNIGNQIDKAVSEGMITTGQVLKYYPALSKCMVKVDGSNETVICKNLLLMNGGLLFLYTPMGDASYCDVLHEPCVLPWGRLDCVVSPLANSKEWLLLGFYLREELIGVNPSKNGQFKIVALGSLGEYSLRFGVEGLKIVNNGVIEKEEIDDFGDTVVTDKEYYSKSEVDGLLSDLKQELLDSFGGSAPTGDGDCDVESVLESLLDVAISEED